MSDKDTQTHATHPHTQRHMHARERPRVRADTRLHVGAKALRRESGEMGEGWGAIPQDWEELRQKVPERLRRTRRCCWKERISQWVRRGSGDTKAVVLRANKKPIHDRYVVTRTAKDTITGK